jgi:hypothetical protein
MYIYIVCRLCTSLDLDISCLNYARVQGVSSPTPAQKQALRDKAMSSARSRRTSVGDFAALVQQAMCMHGGKNSNKRQFAYHEHGRNLAPMPCQNRQHKFRKSTLHTALSLPPPIPPT